MPEIVTYFGPPGTGKTRALLDCVRAELDRGVHPEQIAFVAFTRRAAGEARARGELELELTQEEMVWWRTLHSTAARELGIGGKDLVVSNHWNRLGEILGMQFSNLDEYGRMTSFKRNLGHRVQSEYYLRRARMQSMVWGDLVDELGPALAHHVCRFGKTVQAYKAGSDLMDYSDLIYRAPGATGARVVIVDEAQDLTAAQWEYVQRLWAGAERAYVAGDDEQAIFAWAGADVNQFLAVPGERIILDISYRLPRAAYSLARRISEGIKIKQEKSWRPDDRQGEVHRAMNPDKLPLADGDWLLLSRTRSGLETWERSCRLAGVRYILAGVDSVRNDEVRAIRAWERARSGREDIDQDDLSLAETLAGELSGKDTPLWREALTGIPKERRLYYELCLRRDKRSLYDPATVRIDTIHGAKGAEASNVGLLPDLAPRIEQGMAADPDAEHRVWYVAVTRCIHRLFIAEPAGDLFYRGI